MLAKGDNKSISEELLKGLNGNVEFASDFDMDDDNDLEDFEYDEDEGISMDSHEDDSVEFAEDFEPEDFIFSDEEDEDDNDLEDFEPDEDEE